MKTDCDPDIFAALTRRRFIGAAAAVTAAAFAGLPRVSGAASPIMLPALPYPENALQTLH